ncbi:MAG: AAA family ATPase [Deferribacteres bacterium]|nr:AAA family ATPase [Deferribacteres bacterium]
MLGELFEIQHELSRNIDLSFKRYLYETINWDTRLIILTGSRGVGKTTLLLQYIRERGAAPEEYLYISADNILVDSHGLFRIASEFHKFGGRVLIIDEIHKYPDWSRELKNIYDSLPKLNIIVSGSSSLDIIKGRYDLSRRAVLYTLRGLSFREFLILNLGKDIRQVPLKKILSNHVEISRDLKETAEKSGRKILRLFTDYLKFGYYPYYLEGTGDYFIKLNNVMEKVIYEDIPSVFKLKQTSIPYLKKLIYLIATSSPFHPNIARISSNLGISKEYVYNYIDYLEKAGLFMFLYPPERGLRLVRKPEKIYLENTNLYRAIEGDRRFSIESGTVRETFAVNQLKALHAVFSSEKADLMIDGRYVFEIGGRTKGKKENGGADDAFILSDGIETGYAKKIPLWLLGLLY